MEQQVQIVAETDKAAALFTNYVYFHHKEYFVVFFAMRHFALLIQVAISAQQQ